MNSLGNLTHGNVESLGWVETRARHDETIPGDKGRKIAGVSTCKNGPQRPSAPVIASGTDACGITRNVEFRT
jgi:hypothetical protein